MQNNQRIEDNINKLCGFVDVIESGSAQDTDALMKTAIADWLEYM